MKKIVTSLAIAMAATSAFAGGLLTTTNQNAHSLRFFSQEADINLTSLYANPAGQAFLNKGWHISASSMTAIQTRNIQSTFPLFALKDGNQTHNFEGKAFAPVVPSFDFAYVQDKWSVSARFGVVAGGGTCEFEDGLGSLEALAAKQAFDKLEAQGLALQGYNLNSFMTGKQNYFGFQVGGTYKILNNLSAYVGVRGIYATCGYEGGITDVEAKFTHPLAGAMTQPSDDILLNCQQSGFGITPIIGIHYRPIKGLELAAKYEFQTKINLKNTTTPESAVATSLLPLYANGNKVRTDMPGLLTIGAQYRPIENLKIAASWRYYFDKSSYKTGFADFDNNNSKEFGNMNDLVDNNTQEFLASVEYKFCKWVAASFSWQNTSFGLSDAYMSDTDFTLSSNSIGGGLRIYPCKLLNIDLGYMHTFYQNRELTDANGIQNKFSRNNNAFGIGLNFAF